MCQVVVGPVKDRVARARSKLACALGLTGEADLCPDDGTKAAPAVKRIARRAKKWTRFFAVDGASLKGMSIGIGSKRGPAFGSDALALTKI